MERKHPPAIGLDECLAASGGTKALITGSGVYAEIPRLLETHYGSRRIFLIADTNTLKAIGGEPEQVFGGEIEIAGRYIFDAEPRLHAEYSHVQTLAYEFSHMKAFYRRTEGGGAFPFLRRLLRGGGKGGGDNANVNNGGKGGGGKSNANGNSGGGKSGGNNSKGNPPIPVALGSGTINDLVKRAASEAALPYLCIPTAASVDGFTSFGSAILKDGFKQTLPCDAPRCIVADTGVLSRAPAWLSSSGFADLAGKISAGADWIVADAVAACGAKGADRIEQTAWAMVQNGLHDYLDRSIAAAQGNEGALAALFEALSITGLAMQYAKSSRPVSGAEHLFAHIWEMDDLSLDGVPVTHGHKVAIGSLTATAFLETLFADPDGPPPPPAAYRRPTLDDQIAEAKAAFASSQSSHPALNSVVKTCVAKYPSARTLARTREGALDTWKELRAKVLEQIMPYAELKAMLATARCPVLPGEIGLSRAAVIASARRARMIRNRYSSLDLAWDTDCFETVLTRMEDSRSYLY